MASTSAISLFTVALILCVFSAVVAALSLDAQPATSDHIIDEVNAKTKKWRAAHNHLTKKSISELKQILGTREMTTFQASPAELLRMKRAAQLSLRKMPANGLPESFDTRQQWPGCIHPIRDQGHCGSCWAFGGSEVLSDRFCIASNGTVNRVLAPQDLVNCNHLNQGCNGGILPVLWFYLKETGIVDEACLPYTSGTTQKAGSCPSTCVDGSDFKSRKHRADHFYHVGSVIPFTKHEEAIMNELVNHGPVETGFTVYQDFISYKTGVYHHVSGSQLGGHAVKIVGYGVENGTKYWTAANSWTENWGDNGFFRIQKGNNECSFESGVWTGLADVKNAPKF